MKSFSHYYLTFARFFLLLLVIGAAVNLASTVYDTGYVVGSSIKKPRGLLTLQLDRNRPYHGPLYNLTVAARNGWHMRPWAQRHQDGPVTSVADSVSPTFKQAPFELLTEQNHQVLRYVENSFTNRLLLLWLGAAPHQMSVVKAALVFGILLLLWLMVRDLALASPFTPKNARRLSLIVILSLCWEAWQALAHVFLYSVVPSFEQHGDVLTRYVILNGDGATPGALGLLVLYVVSFVYQRGVQLQQEAELTV